MFHIEEPGRGTFCKDAMGYCTAGIPVMPCGGDDGKTPLIQGWRTFRGPPSAGTIGTWWKKFPAANIGILTGKISGITVVDCDDHAMIARCGETPVKVSTPRGGVHLDYAHSGERCSTCLDGMKIDVRGEGGFVVAPPSTRPGHEQPYCVTSGTLADLRRLPPVKPGSLPTVHTRTGGTAPDDDVIHEGERNIWLFRQALRQVRASESEEHLFMVLDMFNGRYCDPPLPDAEVRKIVRSALKYEGQGRNWAGSEARAVLEPQEMDLLLGEDGNVMKLLVDLRRCHGHRGGEAFALANAATRRLHMSLDGFRRARMRLVELGFIECLHQGGKGRCDPPLYRLLQGARKGYQYNNTRPPRQAAVRVMEDEGSRTHEQWCRLLAEELGVSGDPA